jgi:hypothetical protein
MMQDAASLAILRFSSGCLSALYCRQVVGGGVGDCAAAGPDHQLLKGEHVQVPADGRGGHAEFVGQGVYLDVAGLR